MSSLLMVASFPGQLEKRPGFCCSHRHLIFRHSQGIHDSFPLCCDIHSVYTFDNVHKTWILLFCMPSSDSEVKQWCLNSNKRVYKNCYVLGDTCRHEYTCI